MNTISFFLMFFVFLMVLIMLLIDPFINWKNISGRARRLEFGIVFAVSIIVFIALSALAIYIYSVLFENQSKEFYSTQNLSNMGSSLLAELIVTGSAHQTGMAIQQSYNDMVWNNVFISLLTYIPFLPFLVVLISTAVRRLHDIGTFGWWLLIVGVPLWLFFDLWIVIAPMLFLVFKDGQRHHNKYGADPKNPNAPLPLEMPKENQNLKNFEEKVNHLVAKAKVVLEPLLAKFTQKFKNKE